MKPLAGKTVLVTRPQAQAHGLIVDLELLGAKVFAMPAIEIAPPEDFTRLDEALRKVEDYDWIVFTSVNGVWSVLARMKELSLRRTSLDKPKIAAIGPATAEEISRHLGRQPDLVPSEFVSEAIADALGNVDGLRFLLPRADIARKDLAIQLRAKGAVVDEVAAYRIVPTSTARDTLPADAPDFITLTSSASARNTLEILRDNGLEAWFGQARLVSIGPITSATIRELGYEVALEATEYTASGLAAALIDHAAKELADAR